MASASEISFPLDALLTRAARDVERRRVLAPLGSGVEDHRPWRLAIVATSSGLTGPVSASHSSKKSLSARLRS